DPRRGVVPACGSRRGSDCAGTRRGRECASAGGSAAVRGGIRRRRDRAAPRCRIRGRCRVTTALHALRNRLLAPIGGRVALEVGSTFLGNAYAALAAFAGGTLLAHWLGPELRGVFELGLFAANSALLALGLGLNVATTVFVANQPARGFWAYRLGMRLVVTYAVAGAAFVLAAQSLLGAARVVPLATALAALLVFLA